MITTISRWTNLEHAASAPGIVSLPVRARTHTHTLAIMSIIRHLDALGEPG